MTEKIEIYFALKKELVHKHSELEPFVLGEDPAGEYLFRVMDVDAIESIIGEKICFNKKDVVELVRMRKDGKANTN